MPGRAARRMHAFNYRAYNLELDACTEGHGFWLDAGESERVLEVMKERVAGLAALRLRKRTGPRLAKRGVRGGVIGQDQGPVPRASSAFRPDSELPATAVHAPISCADGIEGNREARVAGGAGSQASSRSNPVPYVLAPPASVCDGAPAPATERSTRRSGRSSASSLRPMPTFSKTSSPRRSEWRAPRTVVR